MLDIISLGLIIQKPLNKAQLTLNKALLNEEIKKPLREKYPAFLKNLKMSFSSFQMKHDKIHSKFNMLSNNKEIFYRLTFQELPIVLILSGYIQAHAL